MMPELDHAEAQELIHAAIDGELDTVDMMRFEAHLAACPDCTADYARLSALSGAVGERATRFAAPDELRAALLGSLGMSAVSPPPNPPPSRGRVSDHVPPPRWGRLGEGESHREPGTIVPFAKPRRWLPPAAGGFAVGAALAAGLALLITTHSAVDSVTDSIVAAHIRAMQQPGHLTDVQVSDQHQVKPWFDGKIDFAPPVKNLDAQGFDLVGGRLDYFQGREAAVVVYRHHLHLIELFVTRADGKTGSAPSPAPQATPSGYNVEHWTEDGREYWAISDLESTGLASFVQLVRDR